MSEVTTAYIQQLDTTIEVGDDVEIEWKITGTLRDKITRIRSCTPGQIQCGQPTCSGLVVEGEKSAFHGHCLNHNILKVHIHSRPSKIVNKVVIV